jgi:hypothetical protein
VTVERTAFFALFQPGLRGLSERAREQGVSRLLGARPQLQDRLVLEQRRADVERGFFKQSPDYPSMPGDPDLYKFFCTRYERLLRSVGRLGVVLPRSSLSTKGSEHFRRWLFERQAPTRIDFLLNNRLWMFDTHPQYTVALVAAERRPPEEGHRVRVAGVARSAKDWECQAASPGLAYAPEAFGPG